MNVKDNDGSTQVSTTDAFARPLARLIALWQVDIDDSPMVA